MSHLVRRLGKEVCVCAKFFSLVRLFTTLWTIALQAPLSTRFSRQEFQSRFPGRSQGDLPDPGIEHRSLMSPTLQKGSLPLTPHGKPQVSKQVTMKQNQGTKYYQSTHMCNFFSFIPSLTSKHFLLLTEIYYNTKKTGYWDKRKIILIF